MLFWTVLLFKSEMCSFCELAASSRITKIIKQVPQTHPLTAISQINHRPRPQTHLIGWASAAMLDLSEFSNKQRNVLIAPQCLYFSADLMLSLMHLGNLYLRVRRSLLWHIMHSSRSRKYPKQNKNNYIVNDKPIWFQNVFYYFYI